MRFATSMLFTLGMMVFAAWVMLPPSPNERMERVCKPIVWTGKAAVAVSDLASQKYSPDVERFFEKADYSCRYVIWKVFYQEEWLKKRLQQSQPSSAQQ